MTSIRRTTTLLAIAATLATTHPAAAHASHDAGAARPLILNGRPLVESLSIDLVSPVLSLDPSITPWHSRREGGQARSRGRRVRGGAKVGALVGAIAGAAFGARSGYLWCRNEHGKPCAGMGYSWGMLGGMIGVGVGAGVGAIVGLVRP